MQLLFSHFLSNFPTTLVYLLQVKELFRIHIHVVEKTLPRDGEKSQNLHEAVILINLNFGLLQMVTSFITVGGISYT